MQVGAPGRRLVVLHPVVPEQGEAAAGPDHARELGDGARRVEPVEGVRADDRVERGAGQRERLRGGVERLGAGQLPDQALAQPGERLHRDDVEARGEQRAGQLARARADVGDARAGREPELPGHGRDDLRRVAGPAELVLLRHVGEAGDERMEGHGGSLDTPPFRVWRSRDAGVLVARRGAAGAARDLRALDARGRLPVRPVLAHRPARGRRDRVDVPARLVVHARQRGRPRARIAVGAALVTGCAATFGATAPALLAVAVVAAALLAGGERLMRRHVAA